VCFLASFFLLWSPVNFPPHWHALFRPRLSLPISPFPFSRTRQRSEPTLCPPSLPPYAWGEHHPKQLAATFCLTDALVCLQTPSSTEVEMRTVPFHIEIPPVYNLFLAPPNSLRYWKGPGLRLFVWGKSDIFLSRALARKYGKCRPLFFFFGPIFVMPE